jgi:hypothetical protein
MTTALELEPPKATDDPHTAVARLTGLADMDSGFF